MELLKKLLNRAVVFAIVLPILLFVGYVGGWLLAVGIIVLVWLGLSEYYSALYRKNLRPAAGLGFVGAVLVMVAAVNPDPSRSWMLTVLAIVAVAALSLVIQIVRPGGESAVVNSATTVFGVVYVALLMSFFLRLREYDLATMVGFVDASEFTHRLGTILLVLVPIWFMDTCAFIMGNLWGRHKLAPTISPGKTIEGSVGGFIGCIAMTALVGTLLHLPLLHILSVGTLMGVASQVGDLGKSALKRDIGIKDFSNLFGPHGGVIDRFDGLMFAMPVMYLYLVVFVGMPGL